jgi:ankyrin repeat protein
VQSVSVSESAASSSPLGPFNDNAIQEEHHIDTNEFEYNNHYTQKEKKKPSGPILPMPPIIDEAVKSLTKKKDIDLSSTDIELHGASEGHKGMARIILQKNTPLSREDWSCGETRLNKAAYCDSEDMVRFLLKFNTDVSSRGLDGETALHWAAVRNHKKVARLLLDKGIDLSPNSYGETALHLAACYGHEEIVHLILRKDIDLSQQDLDANTALDLAEYNNHEKIVCLLRRRDMLKIWMGDHDE